MIDDDAFVSVIVLNIYTYVDTSIYKNISTNDILIVCTVYPEYNHFNFDVKTQKN